MCPTSWGNTQVNTTSAVSGSRSRARRARVQTIASVPEPASPPAPGVWPVHPGEPVRSGECAGGSRMFAGQCSRTQRARRATKYTPGLGRNAPCVRIRYVATRLDLRPDSRRQGHVGCSTIAVLELLPCACWALPSTYICVPSLPSTTPLRLGLSRRLVTRATVTTGGPRSPIGAAQRPSHDAGPGGRCAVVSSAYARRDMDPHHGGARNPRRPSFKARSRFGHGLSGRIR